MLLFIKLMHFVLIQTNSECDTSMEIPDFCPLEIPTVSAYFSQEPHFVSVIYSNDV